MPAFSSFDTRNYPTVTPREGYGLWSVSYEETIKEDMDLRLLERIGTVRWDRVERAAISAAGPDGRDHGSGRTASGKWMEWTSPRRCWSGRGPAESTTGWRSPR